MWNSCQKIMKKRDFFQMIARENAKFANGWCPRYPKIRRQFIKFSRHVVICEIKSTPLPELFERMK